MTDTVGHTKAAVGEAGCITRDPRIELVSWTNATIRGALASSPIAAPKSPKDPLSYCTHLGELLLQHLDTLRSIHVLFQQHATALGADRMSVAADTTIWLFTGDTTVRRLSPAPRRFGYAMANTLRGEMQAVMVEQDLIARGIAPVGGPGIPCSVARAPNP